MTDPLSISASVAGLLSLGLQSTEFLYKFYTAYRDRDEDLKKTANQLDDLLNILKTIQDVVSTRQWRTDEESILKNIETCVFECEDVATELSDEMRKFKKIPEDSLSGAVAVWGRRTAYPFRRSTLEKLGEDVNHFYDNLSRALEVLQLKEHQSTRDDVELLKEMMQYAQARDLAHDIRDWLRAPDASIDYNAAAAKKHAGTGQWFLRSQAFNDWIEQDNSFLWLCGFAGCGKSVLCSTTIQHIFRQQQPLPDTATAFFFFTFNDSFKQDTSTMLRALLIQLAAQVSGIHEDLKRLRNASNNSMPPVRTLVEYVRQAVMRSRHTYILVDALDECPDGSQRDNVLETINIMRGWSLPGLHLLVTSRDIVDIRDELDPHPQETVVLRNDEVQNDIQRYVSYCVEHDPKLRRWADDRRTISEYLVAHANGVFRWVECQMDPLRRCPKSKYDLEQCLKQLPSTLDATYEQILLKIDEHSRVRARNLLVLLCLSTSPINVVEATEALAVDVEDQERYDPARKLGGAEDLLRICPGLIEIIYVSEKHRGVVQNYELVQIAHFSVQEYLFSGRIRQSYANSFAISWNSDHAQLSRTCLIYLCDEDFLRQRVTSQLTRQYPFTTFAASYWFYHFQQGKGMLSERLRAWAITFCTDDASISRWTSIYDVDARSLSTVKERSVDGFTNSPSAAYCLVVTGLHDLLTELLKDSAINCDLRGGFYGSALQVASADGHENIVQKLLDAGANVNAQGGWFGSALQAAALRGHEKVVHILLESGADINVRKENDLGSPLYNASNYGHEKIVRMLLNTGADVNADGGKYGSALQVAASLGYEAIVQMLIDGGADANSPWGWYSSALQLASSRGYGKVARLLLDAGADLNDERSYYGSALQAASYHGHQELVQSLLEFGADVKFKGGACGSALQAASTGGYEEVVRMLLDAGADVNVQDKVDNDSALEAASIRGHEKVVSILLQAGAVVDVPGGDEDDSMLYRVSEKGYEKVVSMLLAAGADVNSQGADDTSALYAASSCGHEKVVQVLLDAGADINAPQGWYGGVLQAAVAAGHEEVVRMLLHAGANVMARGKDHSCALYIASANGHEKIVQILLDVRTDDITISEYEQVIEVAAEEGYRNIVRLLQATRSDRVALADLHTKVEQMLQKAEAHLQSTNITPVEREPPYETTIRRGRIGCGCDDE